ncbi:MAG: hypothetical protein Q9218_004793 [Villophora microphyllina]
MPDSLLCGEPRQRTPPMISPLSPTKSPIPTTAPEPSKACIDPTTQDPATDPVAMQLFEAHLADLQSLIEERVNRIKEQEQEVQDMREELFRRQLILGTAQPPAHMKVTNIFDDQSSPESSGEGEFGSPGAMTLVNAEPEISPQADCPDLPSVALGVNHQNTDVISTPGCTPNLVHKLEDQTLPDPKKRKRSSRLSGMKTAHTGDGPQSNLACVPPPEHISVHPSEKSRTRIEYVGHALNSQTPLDDDGIAPQPTARPISWPRSRRLRRSACVSVKKLADVFKELRLQHDRH